MSRARVAVIVEGHGEVDAVPILLERIWRELLGGEYLAVQRPAIRQPRDRLAQNKDATLSKVIELASRKLAQCLDNLDDPELILVLVDADDDLPCVLAPHMLEIATQARSDKRISVVLAAVEFETWFVAAAESLGEFLDLSKDSELPHDPEVAKLGKRWIEKRFLGVRYSETADQAKFTARMDLQACRDKSRSFDKLCRELESLIN